MTEHTSEGPSAERIREEAQAAVRQAPEDIRTRVRDLTLQALTGRQFDGQQIREVVRGMTEGVAAGAEQRGTGMQEALYEALRGIDHALMRSVEAGRLALKEILATGKDVSDRELSAAFNGLRRLEEDFLATAEQVVEGAGELVRPQLREALDQTRRSGTETGLEVAKLVTDLGQRVSGATVQAGIAGVETALELSTRFAMVAGGILAGVAEALRQQEPAQKP